MECLGVKGTHNVIRRVEDPRFIDQLSKRNLAAASPGTTSAGHYLETIPAHDLHVDILVIGWFEKPTQHDVHIALSQFAKFLRAGLRGHDVNDHARMKLAQAIDDGWNEASGSFRAPNPHFPDRGIQQKFDVLQSLAQFVERYSPALEERLRVDGRLNTPGAPIKQPNAKRCFKIGNRCRDRRLRHTQFAGRFDHASATHNGRKDM